MECLATRVSNLTAPCKEALFRVAEYTSDDFHLDRALFLACKDDRDALCPDVRAGQGRVYKCLMKSKMVPGMSEACRESLTLRETLIAKDYKVSRGLRVKCAAEIRENKCERGTRRDENTVK